MPHTLSTNAFARMFECAQTPLELSTVYILTGTNGSVNNCMYMPKKSIEPHLGQDMCCYRWYLEHLAYHPQFAHTSKGKLTLIDKTYLCLMHS